MLPDAARQVDKLAGQGGAGGRRPWRRGGAAVALAGAGLALLAACGPPSAPGAGGGAAASTGAAVSAPGAAAAVDTRPPLQSMKIGIPQPSLSYLPAHVAWKRGYFEEEGIDVEFPLVTGNAIMPALLSGEIDFTTNLSSIGAHAGQGGDSKILQFHAVRLQHVLVVRPEITDVLQMSGKRIGVQSPGTLPAFQAQKMIERYDLHDVTLVATGSEGRAATEAGAVDATVTGVPENLLAERNGMRTLLRFGTILDIPQAGLGTSEATLRDKSDAVQRALRASARALPLVQSKNDDVLAMIAAWIELSPADAARAWDLVADTYSTNGIPTEAQQRAYLGLLQETANVPPEATPDWIFDFTLARRVAADLGLPSQ
jgi:NitT/TauT family transport system substrate-binding protein